MGKSTSNTSRNRPISWLSNKAELVLDCAKTLLIDKSSNAAIDHFVLLKICFFMSKILIENNTTNV